MPRHNSRYMSDRDSLNELAGVVGRHEQDRAQEFAVWVAANKHTWVEEYAAKYNAGQRRKAAKQGAALSDGSYPIYDQEDVNNAAGLSGSGSAAKGTVVAHIKKRVKSLGLKLPKSMTPAAA